MEGQSGKVVRFSLVKTLLNAWFNMFAIFRLSEISSFPSFKGPTVVLVLVLLLMYELKGLLFPFLAIFLSKYFFAALTAFLHFFQIV